jgi:BirA family transcriptional regulator, biotin operon repressor / biotin---[acetyl-CoA-carboxylase] ligase
MAFGRPHRHLASTDSTNDRARELAEAGAPSGTIVTAAEQSEGRGRRGRAWSAPPGKALLLSAILRPLELEHALLPLTVPVAVCEAIESLAPVEARVKWPNDVWIDEAKVAGVLIEARPPEWAVIGIGVNVAIEPAEFPGSLRWPATSVGHGVAVEAVRDAITRALGAWVEADEAEVLAEFRRRDALAGREVSWEGAGVEPGTGPAAGVDDRGNLVVKLAGGERIVLGSGEVTLRVTYGPGRSSAASSASSGPS